MDFEKLLDSSDELYILWIILVVIIGALWVFLPFAIYGIKGHLKALNGKIDSLVSIQQQAHNIVPEKKKEGVVEEDTPDIG